MKKKSPSSDSNASVLTLINNDPDLLLLNIKKANIIAKIEQFENRQKQIDEKVKIFAEKLKSKHKINELNQEIKKEVNDFRNFAENVNLKIKNQYSFNNESVFLVTSDNRKSFYSTIMTKIDFSLTYSQNFYVKHRIFFIEVTTGKIFKDNDLVNPIVIPCDNNGVAIYDPGRL